MLDYLRATVGPCKHEPEVNSDEEPIFFEMQHKGKIFWRVCLCKICKCLYYGFINGEDFT